MNTIVIADSLKSAPELLPLIDQANRCIEREIGPSSVAASALWGLVREGHEQHVSLKLVDGEDSATAVFPTENLANSNGMALTIIRLWGDLLQNRSHREVAGFQTTDERSRIDGDEALNMIINAIYDFSVSQGGEPHVLKLPIRYAVALLNLGASFWGEFFQQIRQSGIRALENQPLFGVPVKLLEGVGAELKVE